MIFTWIFSGAVPGNYCKLEILCLCVKIFLFQKGTSNSIRVDIFSEESLAVRGIIWMIQTVVSNNRAKNAPLRRHLTKLRFASLTYSLVIFGPPFAQSAFKSAIDINLLYKYFEYVQMLSCISVIYVLLLFLNLLIFPL